MKTPITCAKKSESVPVSVVCVYLARCHAAIAQRLVGTSNVYMDAYYRCEEEATVYSDLALMNQRSTAQNGQKESYTYYVPRGKTGQQIPAGSIVKALQYFARAPCKRTGEEIYRSYVRTPAGWIVIAKSGSVYSWSSRSEWMASPVSTNDLVRKAGGGQRISQDHCVARARQSVLGARIEFVWHASLWFQFVGLILFDMFLRKDVNCFENPLNTNNVTAQHECDAVRGDEVMLLVLIVTAGITLRPTR